MSLSSSESCTTGLEDQGATSNGAFTTQELMGIKHRQDDIQAQLERLHNRVSQLSSDQVSLKEFCDAQIYSLETQFDEFQAHAGQLRRLLRSSEATQKKDGQRLNELIDTVDDWKDACTKSTDTVKSIVSHAEAVLRRRTKDLDEALAKFPEVASRLSKKMSQVQLSISILTSRTNVITSRLDNLDDVVKKQSEVDGHLSSIDGELLQLRQAIQDALEMIIDLSVLQSTVSPDAENDRRSEKQHSLATELGATLRCRPKTDTGDHPPNGREDRGVDKSSSPTTKATTAVNNQTGNGGFDYEGPAPHEQQRDDTSAIDPGRRVDIDIGRRVVGTDAMDLHSGANLHADGIASKLAVDLFALQDASPPGRAWYGTATRLRYLPMTSFAMRFNGRILQVCPFSVSALVPCSSPQLALLHSYYESRHMSIGESFLRC
ncbi:hypothetical protein BC629DRAFT_1577776 [Irpex lacteus]|nr:hypothetical protein BC629DRAFT_1577776 [Irpex lacteus]